LADRDGEAHAKLPARLDDLVGIEARVGPHRERTDGSAISDPADCLGQEVGGSPNGVGPTLAQTCHEHVASAGSDREEGVITTDAGVPVVESALLGQAVCLADRRVEIDRERLGSGSGSRSPGPSQQFPTDPVELADVAPAEAAQE